MDPAKKGLPHPSGPLSTVIPASSIAAANEEVKKIVTTGENKNERGPYVKFSNEAKLVIARYAAENGIAASLRHFASRFPDLKESSVRTWRNLYQTELSRKRKVKDDSDILELPQKKKGRPLLLGDKLDDQVKSYVQYLRTKGTPVNTAVVLGIASGIVKNHDSGLLASNGGHIVLGKPWAKHLLCRMGYVKRRGSTAAKVAVSNFEEVKQQFLLDIKVVVEIEEIPSELVINWDQTGINYVPSDSYTMEKEGTKRVPIIAADDKRQITAVFAGTLTGSFLPPQLIYKGTTKRCLPTVKFPNDWHITCSDNHWSNESTMIAYLQNILFPYIDCKREQLKLGVNFPALVIFDNFKAQRTEKVLKLLEDHHIRVVMVPANCTDRLQPLDISVNKSIKVFLRQEFQNWYSDCLCAQLQGGESNPEPIDLKLSSVKPLGAQWMIKAHDHVRSHPEIVVNGFKGSGIYNCINN